MLIRLLVSIGQVLWGRAAANRRLASEAGFAVPTVTFILLAALAIAGAAVSASLGGQGGIVRDQESKTALAVAESGVEQALLQYNRYGLVQDAAPCAPVGGTVPDATGWCPEVTATVNGGSVSYRVKPTSTAMKNGKTAWTAMEVVSVGALSGVTRRVDVTANSSAGQGIFVDATVQSEDGINVAANAEIHAGTATNGDINLNGKLCGPATVGIGKELTGEKGHFSDIDCSIPGGGAPEDEIDLPPVNQGTAASVNDNHRLFALDQISSNNKTSVCFNGFNGLGQADKSCGSRELVVGHNTSVILGGSVYSFCKLKMDQNSSLYIAPGQEVTIYFDSPEACHYSSGVTQLELQSNTRITPIEGYSGSAALLFVGSATTSTNILMNSNTSVEEDVVCQQNFVIYAPNTDINLDSNTWFCGAMAGKTVNLKSHAEVWTSGGVQEFFLPLTAPHYEATRFVDCTSAVAAGVPSEGC